MGDRKRETCKKKKVKRRDTEEKKAAGEAERSFNRLIHEGFLGCDDTSEEIHREEEGRKHSSRKRLTRLSNHNSVLCVCVCVGGVLSTGQIWEIQVNLPGIPDRLIQMINRVCQGQSWHALKDNQQTVFFFFYFFLKCCLTVFIHRQRGHK